MGLRMTFQSPESQSGSVVTKMKRRIKKCHLLSLLNLFLASPLSSFQDLHPIDAEGRKEKLLRHLVVLSFWRESKHQSPELLHTHDAQPCLPGPRAQVLVTVPDILIEYAADPQAGVSNIKGLVSAMTI